MAPLGSGNVLILCFLPEGIQSLDFSPKSRKRTAGLMETAEVGFFGNTRCATVGLVQLQ